MDDSFRPVWIEGVHLQSISTTGRQGKCMGAPTQSFAQPLWHAYVFKGTRCQAGENVLVLEDEHREKASSMSHFLLLSNNMSLYGFLPSFIFTCAMSILCQNK